MAGQMERRDGLAVPADLTGGRTVMNTETPEALMPAVFAESGSYYLLAFAPAEPKANGRLHKIQVKVDRPGVSVRTRSGYVAGPARPQPIASRRSDRPRPWRRSRASCRAPTCR